MKFRWVKDDTRSINQYPKVGMYCTKYITKSTGCIIEHKLVKTHHRELTRRTKMRWYFSNVHLKINFKKKSLNNTEYIIYWSYELTVGSRKLKGNTVPQKKNKKKKTWYDIQASLSPCVAAIIVSSAHLSDDTRFCQI